MALDRAQKYLSQKRVSEFQDWGSVALDQEGLTLQAVLEERQTVNSRSLWLLIPKY